MLLAPSLTDRREGLKLKNFLKIRNNEMSQYLQSLIPEKIGTKRPQSRNPDNFYSMRARIETYRSSFIPSAVRLYNSLDIVDRSFEYVNSLMKRPSPSLFYYGSTSSGIKHAQLRMRCSKHNFHLFSLHVVDSPHVHVDTIARTQIITCYDVHCFTKLEICC